MNDTIISKYKKKIDELAKKFNYDNNIKHLLYLIIPAFTQKYKGEEKLILDVFTNTPIIINNENSPYINAYYVSIPNYIDNKLTTSKYIVINNYEKINLITLLDNLIHEYNHAINSYNNEISIKNNIIYIRTGLSEIIYEEKTLKQLEKTKSYILEEVINTKQTESIVNIIKNYTSSNIDTINNTIYAINNETNKNYNSNAYLLETNILKELTNNSTFIYTLENLRINGQTEDIETWFNNITGIKNSYNKLIELLNKIMNLELKLQTQKYFKSFTIAKIKSYIKDINYIIITFNENCNYR